MRMPLFSLLLLMLTTEASGHPRPPRQGAATVKDTTSTCCPVLELRQYTLHPGQRDVLIALFDQEFVESQEVLGARIVGQFRDSERPDRFVWLRGFQDMRLREQALRAFYGGPVWKAHREAANATMVDSSNVLLLRPVDGRSGLPAPSVPRSAVGARELPSSFVLVTLYFRDAPVDDEFLRFFEHQVKPVLAQEGAPPVAVLQSEYAENTFPALPVRQGEHVLVTFAVFPSRERYLAHVERLARSRTWNEHVLPALLTRLKSAPEQLVLEPTARSLLR
jgi:hypothetical protein